jgi:hypothetical protein
MGGDGRGRGKGKGGIGGKREGEEVEGTRKRRKRRRARGAAFPVREGGGVYPGDEEGEKMALRILTTKKMQIILRT